jgi:predicted hydrocarbon binding protein
MPGPQGQYFYTDRIVRYYILAMEEIMGKNGLNAVLNMAKLSHLIDNYPPEDMEKKFDFADFAALNAALEEMYGPRGGRGLALRAGRAGFARGLQGFGALVGASDLAFKVLPLGTKLKLGLPMMAAVFNQFSDQISRVEEKEDHFVYYIDRCPVCWGRKTDKPVCFAAAGLLQEGLRWVSGGKEFRVDETTCIGMGDQACTFIIYKEPVG